MGFVVSVPLTSLPLCPARRLVPGDRNLVLHTLARFTLSTSLVTATTNDLHLARDDTLHQFIARSLVTERLSCYQFTSSTGELFLADPQLLGSLSDHGSTSTSDNRWHIAYLLVQYRSHLLSRSQPDEVCYGQLIVLLPFLVHLRYRRLHLLIEEAVDAGRDREQLESVVDVLGMDVELVHVVVLFLFLFVVGNL